MTVKLELDPETEAGLFQQAQANGLSLEAYVEKVLRERSCGANGPDNLVSKKRPGGRKSLVEVFSPLRGLDLDFGRNKSIGRPVDL